MTAGAIKFSNFDFGLPDRKKTYDLGFEHGREYERKYGPAPGRMNPVLHHIGVQRRAFMEDHNAYPTRVYLGTAEVHTLQAELSWMDIHHRRLSRPQTVMGLELFEVKDQYHLRVA